MPLQMFTNKHTHT